MSAGTLLLAVWLAAVATILIWQFLSGAFVSDAPAEPEPAYAEIPAPVDWGHRPAA